MVCFFLCTELTLFCTELPKNCIYLNQSQLSNFFMYAISSSIVISSGIVIIIITIFIIAFKSKK